MPLLIKCGQGFEKWGFQSFPLSNSYFGRDMETNLKEYITQNKDVITHQTSILKNKLT